MQSIRDGAEVLTTRLQLRPHVEGDFAESAAMWGDPIVARFIGGKPFSEEETWTKVLRYVGHWALRGYGYWVVRERATARFVGEVGFADFKRLLTPPVPCAPEAGWALAPWAHGRGFATEALHAAHAWLDARPDAARTVCIIDPGNDASVRVAERCGYREIASVTYRGAPTRLFERVRPS